MFSSHGFIAGVAGILLAFASARAWALDAAGMAAVYKSNADYEQAQRSGDKQWVLDSPREPVPDPGRYPVVVETPREKRPPWSPPPSRPRRTPAPTP